MTGEHSAVPSREVSLFNSTGIFYLGIPHKPSRDPAMYNKLFVFLLLPDTNTHF